MKFYKPYFRYPKQNGKRIGINLKIIFALNLSEKRVFLFLPIK